MRAHAIAVAAASIFAALTALTACSSDPSAPADAGEDSGPPDLGEPDAGHDDAEPPPDTGPDDAGPDPDAGMRFNAVTCTPCDSMGMCPSGACLTNSQIRESFCADPCDADQFGCVTGFICLDIDPNMATTQFFCVPPNASCLEEGVGFGGECYGDTSTCLTFQHRCEADIYALGYCTEACGIDDDCPSGWACLPGDEGESVCKPRFITTAEQCARIGAIDETPCRIDHDCGAVPNSSCVRSEESLPGVCAVSCAGSAVGDACGDGTGRCSNTLRGPACLTETCACHARADVPSGTRDLFEEVLAMLELSRCGAIFGIYDWTLVPNDILEDPYRLSFFDHIHHEPLRAPGWGRDVVRGLDEAAVLQMPITARAARMVEHLAELVDRPAVLHAQGMLDPVEPLASAIAALITETGGAPNVPQLRADAAAVPMDLQLALAGVIDAMQRAFAARRTAVESAPTALTALYDYGPAFVVRRADGFGLTPANAANRTLFNTGFKYGEMYGAAVDVLDAIADADLERFRAAGSGGAATSSAAFVFRADTPIGRIAISDGESGLYNSNDPDYSGAWALLLDLGGNDEYRVPVAGNISAANAVSVLIDLDGDDFYGYVEAPHQLDGTRMVSDAGGRYRPMADPSRDNGPISLSDVPRQGGARMGTAIHVDLGGGVDRYRSLRMSQGSGVFGAGVLVDDGGGDTYDVEALAQGAGTFGIGLLYDGGGSDTRNAYSAAQGFAYARAAGLLYDVDGDDQYLMNVGDPAAGGDPLYLNAQRPGSANTTIGQGFGFGRRADMTDRAFMSGGVGILVDAAGNDRYRGSVFAQGGGFWFGTGILADQSGNDDYDTMWYGMGSGAHYSLGLLFDGAGDDRYGGTLPKHNVTIGAGHDYSAAFLIDESGNDYYNGPRITVGAGNSSGMGFFIDNAGDDQYFANGAFSFGAGGLSGSDVDFAGSPRRSVHVVGMFVDAGGVDTYEYTVAGMPSNLGIGDSMGWTQTYNMNPIVQRIEKGGGVDGEGESTFHARWP